MAEQKKRPLALWIFAGLVVGIVAGLAFMVLPNGVSLAKTYVAPVGTIFLNPTSSSWCPSSSSRS